MDYYTRKRAAQREQARRDARKSLIKDIATAVVTVPVLWVLAVLWLSI